MRPRSVTAMPWACAARPDTITALPAGRAPPAPAARPLPGFAGMADEGLELAAERLGVLLAQVDLVRRAVEGEPHRLFRGAAIKIVFQNDGYLLRHPRLPDHLHRTRSTAMVRQLYRASHPVDFCFAAECRLLLSRRFWCLRLIAVVVFLRGGAVPRSRSSGVLGAWAEAQRRQQRQHEAQQRAWRAEQQERERAQRAAVRAQARDQREALRAHQHGRDMDAAARTSEADAQVARLTGILPSVLAAPPFQVEQLIREIAIAPFAPGPLGVPVVMPDQRAYQVQPPGGLRALSSAARRDHQQACRQAEQQFEQDCRAAAQAEEQRQRQLAEYYRQYQAWAQRERQKIVDHNGQVRLIGHQMTSGDPDAVCEYFAAALYASAGWPEDFPRRARAEWDRADHHLLVDWELPGFDVVPAVSRYRYIKADDRETQIPRPAGERKSLYRNALAQSALAVIAEIFRADRTRLVSTVTVNGFVSGADPATGRRSKVFLLTATAGRPAFGHLDLARVDPVSCLEGLPGQFSPRPETLAPVRPVRLAAPAADLHDEAGATQASLLDMDPIDFEDLVAALFKAMGMEVMTTERSGDGGVDVRAMDPDPIRGGKLVIQVKRYRSTIPPAPVRDLYGTMLHEGATKGILVTTAEFGPSAQEFAAGKPLTLIGGKQLADLLARYGIR